MNIKNNFQKKIPPDLKGFKRVLIPTGRVVSIHLSGFPRNGMSQAAVFEQF
jgi:hypothetical protein